MAQIDVSSDSSDDELRKTDYFVNDEPFRTRDPIVSGREVLSKAGFIPADQHILVQIRDQQTTGRELDEKITLRTAGPEHFRAFPGDRLFTFTVEQRSQVWGEPQIKETELRSIIEIGDDEIFLLEKQDEADVRIRDGASINLSAFGAERIAVIQRPNIQVKVNNQGVSMSWGFSTGAAIKEAAIAQGVDIEEDFTLTLEVTNGDDLVIGDEDPVFLDGEECFDALDNHEDS